jgi:membrane protein
MGLYDTLSKIIHFLKYDLWRIRLGSLSPIKSFLIKQLRILLLVFRGMNENKTSLRASALTFYSLLSLVPAAALVFGIAKGFGMQTRMQTLLRGKLEIMEGQKEIIEYIINFANTALEDTKGGIIAGVGVAVFLLVIIQVLGTIEQSFNDIWGVRQSRTLARRLSNYLSVIFVAPILIIMSSSMTVFIVTKVKYITQKIDLLGAVSPLILFGLHLFPYCVIWLLFSFIYIFMPNTKVKWESGILAGFIAGTIYEIVQWVYIIFQIGVAKYGAIYGGFAILPLFMIWMQLSWLIVLFGAEISFAHQNVETYELEPESLGASQSFKRLLAISISHLCVKKFVRGEAPMSAVEIATVLETPVRLTNQILYELVSCRILSESIGEDEKVVFYQPARDVDGLSISFILHSLDDLGSEEIPIRRSSEIEKISECMERLERILESSEANMLLKDI